MITFHLWQALIIRPETHPVFTRLIAPRPNAKPEKKPPGLKGSIGAGIGVGILMGLNGGFFGALLASVGAAVSFFVPLFANAACLYWINHIGAYLTRSRAGGMFDLLALMPPGGLGLHWLISRSYLHKAYMLQGFFFALNTIEIASLIMVLTGVIASYIITPNFIELPSLIQVIGSSALFYIDALQSVILALLLTIFISTWSPNRIEASLYESAAFLALQVAIYAVGGWVGYSFLPDLVSDLGLDGWLMDILLSLVRFALICGAREAVITLLWRELLERFGASADDMLPAPAG